MAPACVVLDRTVTFRDHPPQPDPPPVTAVGRGGDEAAASSSEADQLSLPDDMGQSKYMLAMKPHLQVVDSPGVSRLTLVLPPASHPTPKYGFRRPNCFAVAGDNNLIVLDVSYQIGSSDRFYLLVDSATSSLSRIPCFCYKPPHSDFRCAGYRSAGCGTVIMVRQGGAFVLAQLLFSFKSRTAMALLGLWHSSPEKKSSEWVCKVGHLPDKVFRPWSVHMSFPVQSRNLFCWVSLLRGLLLWDLGSHHCEAEVDSSLSDLTGMSFVPLPDDCSISQEIIYNPKDFRNMACVDGTIKFVTMDVQGGSPVSLITYTLHLDGPSPSWTKDTVMRLDHLWADTFFSTGVPRIKPLFPILSTQDHDVVYLVIPAAHLDEEDGYKFRGVQSMLSVDTRNTRVVSSATQDNCPRTWVDARFFLTFHDSKRGSEHHQSAVEAMGMGASGKRMKFE